MKGYTSETIRNVALLGHGGCGKTTFLESALYETGVIKKLGKVEDGNTVSDYDKMEVEKGYSINTGEKYFNVIPYDGGCVKGKVLLVGKEDFVYYDYTTSNGVFNLTVRADSPADRKGKTVTVDYKMKRLEERTLITFRVLLQIIANQKKYHIFFTS